MQSEPLDGQLGAQAITTRYVSTTGNDNAGTNTCILLGSPCKTIQRALNADPDGGDLIMVASGLYTSAGSGNPTPNVLIVVRSATLSGGWDTGFSAQTGASVIDGETVNNGILVNTTEPVTVDRFEIRNSKSYDSGAIYVLFSHLTLTNSTLQGNQATNRGAGVFLINNGSLTALNSTISGNTAGKSGGGVFATSGSSVSLDYSTVAYNLANSGAAGEGGGGLARPAGAVGTFSVHDTILANNSAVTSGPDCLGAITSSDYNIYGSTSDCSVTLGGNDQTADPKVNSALSGTPPVHALLSGSPAIDAGSAGGCPATDERGTRGRKAACDIQRSRRGVWNGSRP
jgi:hypothetical protein